jgi:hypothetical protein
MTEAEKPSPPDLPVIALHDMYGYAVIVEAPTGVEYLFAPEGLDGPYLLVEGFLMPVYVDEAIENATTPEEAAAAISYQRGDRGKPIQLRADRSRSSNVIRCWAAVTDLGPGWLLWNFTTEEMQGNGEADAVRRRT